MNYFITILVAIFTLLSLTGCGMEQIDEGHRGIGLVWGRVEGEPLTPGFYFYNPISSDILEMNVQVRKIEENTECFTKDTQKVKINYVLTYEPIPENIGKLYSKSGIHWDRNLIPQVVLGAMKDSVGKYEASDLVEKREHAAKAAQSNIQEALSKTGIIVSRLDFTNLQFEPEYEKAVEAKVTATQAALAEKNKTVQIEEKAKQTIKTAMAEAEAMKIKTAALQQNKSLVQYEMVQRWNGELPRIVMGSNSIPMFDMKELTR